MPLMLNGGIRLLCGRVLKNGCRTPELPVDLQLSGEKLLVEATAPAF